MKSGTFKSDISGTFVSDTSGTFGVIYSFPDYTYNSRLIFVREDGVYISNSHYLNPNFNDDTLGFNRFSLNEV